jgi:hypothetical protein
VQSSFVAAMSENVISSVIDYVDTGKIGSTAMDGSACAKVSIQPESVCAQYDAQGLALITSTSLSLHSSDSSEKNTKAQTVALFGSQQAPDGWYLILIVNDLLNLFWL